MKTSVRHYTALLLLFITFLMSASSCKKDDPVGPEELKPGRRDYVWFADTLPPTPFNMVRRIWGSSENDLWAVAGAGDLDKVIWHFDGNKWTSSPAIGQLDPSCIYGFSSNNIWIGGYTGELWNYNGSKWNKIARLTINEYPNLSIENIFGHSPNDVYAIGTAFNGSGMDYIAFMMHYDGTSWSFVNIPKLKAMLHEIRGGWREKNNYFIQAYRMQPDAADTNKIFLFDGKNLKQLYAGAIDYNGHCDVSQLDGKSYQLIGSKIYRYENEQFLLWKDLSGTDFYARMWGRNEMDFFYMSNNGKGIGHYNGTDFKTIYNNFQIVDAVILKNSVFFYTYDFKTSKHVMLRGQLK